MKQEQMQEAEKCKQCAEICKTKRNTKPIVPVELQQWSPGKLWSLDFFQKWGKDYLAAIDKVSGLILCQQIANKKATPVTKVLERWVIFLGLPSALKSDGGTCFTAEAFGDFCEKYGVT